MLAHEKRARARWKSHRVHSAAHSARPARNRTRAARIQSESREFYLCSENTGGLVACKTARRPLAAPAADFGFDLRSGGGVGERSCGCGKRTADAFESPHYHVAACASTVLTVLRSLLFIPSLTMQGEKISKKFFRIRRNPKFSSNH